MEKKLGPNIRWSDCSTESRQALSVQLQRMAPQRLAAARVTSARRASLPFYQQHVLVDLTLDGVEGIDRVFLLQADDRLHWLDGSSAAIHLVNEAESLVLADEAMLDYVRFFTYFVRGDSGPFTIIAAQHEIQQAGTEPDLPGSETRTGVLARCRAGVVPLSGMGLRDDGRYGVQATIAYGGGLFAARFAIERNGLIEMVEDEPIGVLDGLVVPTLPSLPAQPVDPEDDDDAELIARLENAAGTVDRTQRTDAALAPEERRDDSSVTASVVSVLLAEAVAAALGHALLQRFNASSGAMGPLDPLGRFVQEFTPVILIEAEIPFIEEIVAGLLDPERRVFTTALTERATAVGSDDTCCAVDTRDARTRLHLISFHAYRKLWDAEWTAHRLSIGNATVLIGCDRRADVPDPLRRVADLVLTLPRIDERLFVEIFRQVFGTAPPAGWPARGGEWTRYLLHTDFHAPLRLDLPPDESVAYLRERCNARLAQVSAIDSPGLEDLHGLGEARQVADDLIADVAAARAGRIPWSSVDRGVLLVGPPGTGKTTLARAIARASEVKFIHGSAAQWQSAGALDMHLKAIRETFAEARRYAPAILFIDEIDSLGSREQLSGSNAIYQTDVINAVLEQLQGMDPEEPVMVIGATNYVDKVDPALRRPGRLDQVVVIPRPNVAALGRIFTHHLRPHRDAGQLAPDVDERAVAPLAFGLTGADVEFFVRGAARRARKEGRPITQGDLIAEVTRRPRHPGSVLRLLPKEMHRVAVHEAGHALGTLLEGDGGTPIAFLSIIPRTDGSLGFTATVPDEGAVMTRRQALDRLRTILSGRAAEELVFGADEVGLGAGGGESSDLAVATRIATHLVCSTGLGGNGRLAWTSTPSRAQLAQVEALLGDAYRAAQRLLGQHRATLERIVEALLAAQELDGAAVRELVFESGGVAPARPKARRPNAAAARSAKRPRRR